MSLGYCTGPPAGSGTLDPLQVAWYSYCPQDAGSASNAYSAYMNYLETNPPPWLTFLAWGGNPTDPVYLSLINPANAQYLPPKGQGFIDPQDPNYRPPWLPPITQAPVPLNTPFQNPPIISTIMPSSGMVAPGAPATPTVQQIAGGQTITPNVGTQISNVAGAAPAGFTMPAVLSESSVAGIPNWMLIAGAVLAVMMLKK